MRTINFQKNWNNKLDRSGTVFTTIRGWTQAKEDYYRGLLGQTMMPLLENHPVGFAKLQKVRKAERLSDIPEELLMLDTGARSVEEAYAIFAQFGLTPESPGQSSLGTELME